MDTYDEKKIEVTALELADVIAGKAGLDLKEWIRQKSEAILVDGPKDINWVHFTFRKSKVQNGTEI